VSEDRNVSPDSGRHWADAGAWPTSPGVHRTPFPLPSDGLRAVNVYVVEADDGDVRAYSSKAAITASAVR
jgi:hypothetical protein